MTIRSIEEDISYYIQINYTEVSRKKRCIQQPQQASLFSSLSSTQELAEAWLQHHNNHIVMPALLAAMARLKRQLLFSVDRFVQSLGLTASSPLSLLLASYHKWSQQAYGMLPLISFLLPLIRTTATSADLADCFRYSENDSMTLDYLEALLTYVHRAATTLSDKELIQQWIQSLFEQDRMAVSHYVVGDRDIICSDAYVIYFDLLVNKKRLKYLSRPKRKQLIEQEWANWVMCDNNTFNCDIQPWIAMKESIFNDQEMRDPVSALGRLQSKNITWLMECDDDDHNETTTSSSLSALFETILRQQRSKSKTPGLTMLLSIFHQYCKLLVETGQDSIHIVKILEQARQMLVTHLRGTANSISMLLSMVQIALHHMKSLLTYTQWFQANFVDNTTSCLESKEDTDAYINHLLAMIAIETVPILQIHAKALLDAQQSSTTTYVSQVKSKLLALGVDATLRHYPTDLGKPVILDSLQHHQCDEMDNSTDNSSVNNSNAINGHHPRDLQRLMNTFGETNVVPQSLWEDSIFRPKWFKHTFLPALMISWQPSDTLTLEHRYQMVAALHRKGKIPVSLYTQFMKIVSASASSAK